MTDSHVKRAIDETISKQPLMDDMFVQKVLDGKKQRKKRMPFMQPAIVLVLLFAVGGLLYFMPQQDEQAAVDSEETLYLAKPEHLDDMLVQKRNQSNIIYVFNHGTLYYTSNTHLFYDIPKPEGREPHYAELVEGSYTNIKIRTKNNQYFMTGDDGFSWTLTRTAPRILVDQNGYEYTIPYAFENMPKVSDVLLDDEIQSVGIYKIGGIGTYASIAEEHLEEVNALFQEATVNDAHLNLGIENYKVDIEYKNGNKMRLILWLKEDSELSYVMKNDVVNNTVTIFKIPAALTDYFHQLAERIEEIDNAK